MVCASLKERIKQKGRQRPSPGSQVPMSELPRLRPPQHSSFCRKIPGRVSGERSRGGGRRARVCPPHILQGGGGGGRGGGGPGRARGREEAPGRWGEGSDRRRGKGRARRAAARSGGQAGGSGGQAGQGGSRELHEVPPGPRTGRWLGEAVGGAPTFMARRGPRRRARSKSGLGGEGRARGAREAGVGQQRLRARPGRARLLGLGVSLRRLLGAQRSRQPAAAQFGGFFGNLQMFS